MARPPASGSSADEAHDLYVVGNLLIDLIIKGVAALPGWGEEAIGAGRSDDVGGQGANLARAGARLGLSTAIVSVLGEDGAGARIGETLAGEGIDTTAVESMPGATALSVAAVRPDGERAFLTELGCSDRLDGDLLVRHAPVIRRARAVALVGTSNLPGLTPAAAAAVLSGAWTAGALTMFDPGWSGDRATAAPPELPELLAATDLFLPNRQEAEALTGISDLGEMLRALAERCPGTVIVKSGSEGSAVLVDGRLVTVDALPVTVDSAVGAGDVFGAGVISGLLETGDPVAAMVRGTAVASLYIARAATRFDSIPSWRDAATRVRVRGI